MQGLKRKSRRSESVRERTLDMTTGPIWRNMVAFAVPVFLGQLFQQLYNTADSMIVGNFSGKDALAAVASSGNLIFMLTGFFMGVSLGAGVVISRYFGAKDYETLEAAIHTNIALCWRRKFSSSCKPRRTCCRFQLPICACISSGRSSR